MKTLKITFGTSLNEIKEIALNEFGTLSGVYVSTFNNHYRGNSIGNIFALENEFPYEFNWHSDPEDRGVEDAFLIYGDVEAILEENKRIKSELNVKLQNVTPYLERFNLKYVIIDFRFKKTTIEAQKENNRMYVEQKNKAIADFTSEINAIYEDMSNQICSIVSSKQYFIK